MFFEELIAFDEPVIKGVDINSLSTPLRIPHNVKEFTLEELEAHKYNTLVYDVECYYNYFCVTFTNVEKTRYIRLKQSPDENIDIELLRKLMFMYITVGFNNHHYDLIIVSAVLAGITNTITLKEITADIIEYGLRDREIEKKYGFKILSFSLVNSVDLIEVCPLSNSLKGYAARLHSPRLQDLPIAHDAILTKEDSLVIDDYNLTDCFNTADIACELTEQLALRADLSQRYQVDLRSKSDAQIAEAVIAAEISKITGKYPAKPRPKDGYFCTYTKPAFIEFKTDYLNSLLDTILSLRFYLDKNGSPVMPSFRNGTFKQVTEVDDKDGESKRKIKLQINNTIYTVGIGGLHSCEKSARHVAGNGYKLFDRDVASFYPKIKINCGFYPKHIGPAYLKVYGSLVDRRIAAKRAKNNVEADSLKITINGAFGKLGSKHSILYSPDLMLGVTITGQLSLLMLIEALELAGIEVVSANTDGIVIKCHDSKREEMLAIFADWEAKTGFETEETEYTQLLSKDVNNYIAIKTDGKVKLKGAYSNPWADKKQAIFRFHKNPMTTICIDAVCGYLTDKIPLAKTIKECTDIKKFVCAKKVKGGGYKGNMYLGKVVRWYYANNIHDGIYYIGSGNKVGESDGAKPIMDLPDTLPTDINYDFYIQKCHSILSDIGFYKKESLLF